MAAVALTIAGSDSSGGAGIQADLKTFLANGVYGASVITSVTAQNTTGVQAAVTLPPEIIAAQLTSVATDLQIDAVKTGMLADQATIETVVAGLRKYKLGPLIVDPVMVATSGDRLVDDDALAAARDQLFPLSELITPNLDEAATLLGAEPATTLAEMEKQAQALLSFGPTAVLVKGGHWPQATTETAQSIDVLVTKSDVLHLAASWVETPNTHGTGCTLSAAIAAGRARGMALEAACRSAKAYVTAALEKGRSLGLGQGCGPLDHTAAWDGRRG
jgi:hydroxymethylpyrimidine/phosphomethylpyrimidine kinase